MKGGNPQGDQMTFTITIRREHVLVAILITIFVLAGAL